MKRYLRNFLFLFSLFLSQEAFSSERKTVLILNSDASINAYLTAQSFFKSEFNSPTIEMNLGNRWIEEEEVRKTIRDEKPDIIYAIGSRAYILANRLKESKRIFFSSLLNWDRFSMKSKPQGIANELPASSQMISFRYLFPKIRKIGILYSGKTNEEWVRNTVKISQDFGLEIIAEPIESPEKIKEMTTSLLGRVDALWLIPDPVVIASKETLQGIFSTADAFRKPVFAYRKFFSRFGASLILSIDASTIGKQAAIKIEEMLEGKNNSQGVFNPAGSYILMNMKKVREYQLELNPDALSSVNEVLQ